MTWRGAATVRNRVFRMAFGLFLVAVSAHSIGWCQDAARPEASDGLRLAHGLLRERKFDLAAEEYEHFLASGADGSEADDARFGLANSRLFQGRYKEARRAFDAFLEKAPRHTRARTARYRLGELALMLGDLPEARKALDAFVQGPQHPHLETAWAYLGDVCLGLNDFPAARDAYERSLHDFPRGQLADRSRFGLGRSLAALGDMEAAASLFATLEREGGRDWVDRSRLQLGRIQLARGHWDEALQAFVALDRAAPRGMLKAEATLGRAEALTHLGRPEEAEALLRPLVADGNEPFAPRAALDLATLELGRSRVGAARKLLEEAIPRFQGSPLAPALRFRLAEALQQGGRGDEARAAFLKLAEAHPADAWADDAVARAASLAQESGDHAEVLKLAKSFATQFPTSPLAAEVQFREARALVAVNRSKEAVPLLEDLLGIGHEPGAAAEPAAKAKLAGPAAASARYELALAYRAAGQRAKADALLAGLAGEARGPVAGEARFLVAQGLVDQGKFAEAIEPLKQYLASGPRPGVEDFAMAHLAAAQLGVGQPDEAARTVAALAAKFPASPALPAVRLRLAEAALERGQPGPAADQFRLVLKPGDRAAPVEPAIRTRARLGLGRALWKLGHPAEAAAMLGEFLDEAKDDARAPAVALERAAALEAAGQDPAALAAYAEVAKWYVNAPEASLASLARARLLARSGAAGEAAGLYAELAASPERLKTLAAAGEPADRLTAERGWALADAGKASEADAVFTGLLKEFPASRHAAEARFHLAESANQAGDHAEVVRLLEPLASPKALDAQAAAGPPEAAVSRIVPLTIYRLARSRIAQDDWEAAAATLDRLVRDFPGHPRDREARYLLAEASLRKGRADAAESLLAGLAADAQSPADPPGFAELVRQRRVQALLGLKRWKDALEQTEALRDKLPQDDPAVAELNFARGRALLGLARLDEARQALDAVIQARKGSELAAQAHLLRGETLFHQERFAEALREYWNVDILYESPRWQAAALLEAGKVYERLGRWTEAAETYDRLRTKFPADPHAAEAEARLTAARKQAQASGGPAGKVF